MKKPLMTISMLIHEKKTVFQPMMDAVHGPKVYHWEHYLTQEMSEA